MRAALADARSIPWVTFVNIGAGSGSVRSTFVDATGEQVWRVDAPTPESSNATGWQTMRQDWYLGRLLEIRFLVRGEGTDFFVYSQGATVTDRQSSPRIKLSNDWQEMFLRVRPTAWSRPTTGIDLGGYRTDNPGPSWVEQKRPRIMIVG